jgi:phosphate starvation-inducible PhoH-like protein
VLGDIDDIHFARLTSDDVVRHTLVGRIVDAYTTYDEDRQAERAGRAERQEAAAAPEGANRAERRSSASRDRLPKRGTR